MPTDPTPETRALVEDWWAVKGLTVEEALRNLAFAIDAHTAAAVLAEREAVRGKVCDGCREKV